jgi:bleomycin hydrolase
MKKMSSVIGFLGVLSAILGSVSCARREPGESPAADAAVYKVKKDRPGENTLVMDFGNLPRPLGLEEFKPLFHLPPVEQGNTGTCWSFATTSLLESEIKRLYGVGIKLSEMHTVYWEYLEKARRYIREHGDSALAEGSEPNAVILRLKEYGAVRESDYPGRPSSAAGHDHAGLFEEFRSCLHGFRDRDFWDEDKVIAAVRAILDRRLGPPPETIPVDGKALSPKEYLDQVLRLPLDDYVSFISFEYLPFYTQGEYKVPDNWWHGTNYYNVPLNEFYEAIRESLQKGFTLALAGDISEAGNSGENDIAVVPSFDIPRSFIDQDSREFRFANHTSTDDHVLHLIGWEKRPDGEWFLLKDSWHTAYQGQFKGYFFYREDYIKLKMLAFLVHKDAVVDLLAKFQ